MSEYVSGTVELDERAPTDTLPSEGPRQATGSDFSSSNCGQVQGTATGPALMPGAGYLAINGNTNLSSCIVGNNGANVSSIYVTEMQPGSLCKYMILVNGQGPAGVGSGNLDLSFTDQTGDQYSLTLHSSTAKTHYVRYNSNGPGIVAVQWNP